MSASENKYTNPTIYWHISSEDVDFESAFSVLTAHITDNNLNSRGGGYHNLNSTLTAFDIIISEEKVANSDLCTGQKLRKLVAKNRDILDLDFIHFVGVPVKNEEDYASKAGVIVEDSNIEKAVREVLGVGVAGEENKSFLFLNWKDERSPDAGGAENVHTNIIKRLIKDGHSVTLLTQQYKKLDGKLSEKTEEINRCSIIRVGKNRYTHTFLASWYYSKNLKNKFDIVVSCNNTAPYWVGLLKGKEKHFSLYHQLAREVWFCETGFPLNRIGFYILEPIATFMQSITNPKCITISESSKQDLMYFGFKSENVNTISMGIDIEAVKNLEELNNIEKYNQPTILYFGAVREMKKTLDIVKSFEIAKEKVSNLKLKIAGSVSGDYAKKVLAYIENSKYKYDMEVLGKVSQEKKIELMQKSHVICVTSVKEGWGLIVTEANSQGTVSCVYDVGGLRDSTKNNVTGLVSENGNTKKLAENVVKLLQDKHLYKDLQVSAYNWSKEITFDRCYGDFLKIIFK